MSVTFDESAQVSDTQPFRDHELKHDNGWESVLAIAALLSQRSPAPRSLVDANTSQQTLMDSGDM